jgi:serine/threonine protein phosphatase PrpC
VSSRRFHTATTVVAASPTGAGQDRADIRHRSDGGLTIALADGAGGTGHGALAADAVLAAVAAHHDHPPTANPWRALLLHLDHPTRVANGQTTAVILTVTPTRITGASVGDSAAWLISSRSVSASPTPADSIVELTAGQRRKPLLGAESQLPPLTIDHPPLAADATLLVASDGLFSYAKPSDIVRVIHSIDLADPADPHALTRTITALVDLVRLPSGGLQDDVSIVLVRHARRT